MSNSKIIYSRRTFGEYKEDSYSYIKEYYPDVLSDFSDASVGDILIDINAAVADNLSLNIDRAFQETQLGQAQQRANIFALAKNLGFNFPNKRASVTIVELTVTVPVDGDRPDESYYPILLAGAQVIGGGYVFETLDIVDWGSPYNNKGEQNRAIIPIYNSNGVIVSYEIKKRELVLNGVTNVYKRSIRENDTIPFFKLKIEDTDVIEIMDVALLNDKNIQEPTEDMYKNSENRFHEVSYLAQQRVLIDESVSGEHLKAAKWIEITKKFIKEYDEDGYCYLTFGNGDVESDKFKKSFKSAGVNNNEFLDYYLNTTALGEKLKNEHVLFIRYRSGGGSGANLGVGVLNDIGRHTMVVNGADAKSNNTVKRSIKVKNVIPAFGGNDGLSIEDIRNFASYNFSTQGRCVTLTDYKTMVMKMPGKFGSPHKVNTFKENNKVVISVLSLDSEGKLTNTSTSLLKENIAEYISNYRMINDYVEVRDGRIFNIAVDVYLYVDEGNDSSLVNEIINKVNKHFSIEKFDMNDDIQLTSLINNISNVEGVNNVLDLKLFNKVGEGYSINPIEQEIINESTGEIGIINNTIYSTRDSMFEIKYPEKDIRVFLKKRI